MARKSVSDSMFGGRRSERMSNIVSGKSGRNAPSTVRSTSTLNNPAYGAPVTRMGAYGSTKDQSRVKRQDRLTPEKPLPAGSIDIRGYFGDERTGIRKTIAKPTLKPVPAVAPIKARVKPAETIRTTVRERSSPVKSVSQARSMKPGNYSSGKVSMGGKTYTGFTVSESKGRSGQTTKSVGNWSSTKDAGKSFGKSGVAGTSRNSGGGASKSSGGASKSSGGGRGTTGPSGMGKSGRGTGSKR